MCVQLTGHPPTQSTTAHQVWRLSRAVRRAGAEEGTGTEPRIPRQSGGRLWKPTLTPFFGGQKRQPVVLMRPAKAVPSSQSPQSPVCWSPGVFRNGVSKAAVISLTKLLAQELGPKGIRLNSIAPGWTTSEMTTEYLDSSDGKANVASLPLGRHGKPEDRYPSNSGPFAEVDHERRRP